MIVGFVIAFGLSAVLALIATGFVRQRLADRAILDVPNERSSHEEPTVRGGGWAIIPIIFLGWIAAYALNSPDSFQTELVCLIGAAIGLAWISWKDDTGGIAPKWRLLAHIAAAGLVLAAVPPSSPIFQGLLPGILDRIAALLLWIWFINLFNFMDGIDGIAGVETVSIGLGSALIFGVTATTQELGLAGAVMAGAAIGFLKWNWHPARIFLGDIGSIPLGFLLGWLLLRLAAEGQWAAALILPLYYLVDATITLVRRAVRGERVWQAHRNHFYQRAVQAGKSHAAVSSAIAVCNLMLIGLASLSISDPLPALAGAGIMVVLLLIYLVGPWRKGATA